MYSMKIVGEVFVEIVFFPIWWYTKGLVMTALNLLNFLSNKEKGLGLKVWVKNIFKPMYGQTDWQGKFISVIIRSVQIFFRSIFMFFWILIALFTFITWLGLPLLVTSMIIFQFL